MNLLPQPSTAQYGSDTVVLPLSFHTEAAGLDDLVAEWVEDCRSLFTVALTTASNTSSTPHLILTCASPELTLPALGDDESYDIKIDASGIHVRGRTRSGVRYALQTLLQLGRADDGQLVFPHCQIEDRPRFAWRGLNLDVSRHFLPLSLVKRMVDGMARVKLNVLHLGLSNNQGFRVESRSFPRLHKVASNGDYYTQDEMRALIAFAAARGVRVVPEFNMPGHSTCFTLAYQELATGTPPNALRKTSGVFDDEMNPASVHMDAFLKGFIAEMATLFPDPYWHFGGDEVTGKAWDVDESVGAFKAEHGLNDNRELQAHFTSRVLAELKKNGKKGIGWEEVANGKSPKDTLLQPWITPASNEVFDGYPLIVSTSYYLDHFLYAEDYYGIDPNPGDARDTVIGAEGCIWTEVMNADNVEAVTWPGALALAERFWSPRETTDVSALRARLTPTLKRLETLGAADLDAPTRLAARLCGGSIPPSVATLRDYVAPLVYYFVQDRKQNPHDVTQDFSRLIETLLPETPAMRRLDQDAGAALAGESEALRIHLATFKDLGARFRTETKDLPDLHENQPVADMLEAIASAALQALDGQAPHLDLPLDALMPPASNDLDAILDAVARRRRADLPLLAKETSIPVLPALRRVLESSGFSQKPS